jgi:hypothetical protein
MIQKLIETLKILLKKLHRQPSINYDATLSLDTSSVHL